MSGGRFSEATIIVNLRRSIALLLLVSGIASVAWLIVPTPRAVRPPPTPEAPWKLPVQPAFNAETVLATLNNASLWGKLTDITQSSDIEPEWRFIGSITRGDERQVIIKKDNLPEQTLVVGDALPGGSKILSIEDDRICLLINGQKRSLYVYAQGRLSGKMSEMAEQMPTRQASIGSAPRTQ